MQRKGDGDGEPSAPCTFFAVLLLLHKPTTRTAFTSAHGFPLRLLLLGLWLKFTLTWSIMMPAK